ncbi:hypothetical protein BYT27DRAFT_6894707 [Phlegmacium glaucopus]|nr:hypothetical protein BYT27DRAFT_6894707 [Phlegmacium glaucopus]
MHLAKKYKGLAILLDHSFYGASLPLPVNENATADRWQFLSTEKGPGRRCTLCQFIRSSRFGSSMHHLIRSLVFLFILSWNENRASAYSKSIFCTCTSPSRHGKLLHSSRTSSDQELFCRLYSSHSICRRDIERNKRDYYRRDEF